MSGSEPDSGPSTLEYRSARVEGAGVVYVCMLVLVGETLLFAVSCWGAEYVCQSIYHLRGERREEGMMIETLYIALFAAAFLIVQGLMRPNVAVRVRRYAWVLATGAGVVLCLVRWGVDFSMREWLGEAVQFCLAVLLAAGLAVGISRYRWPRGGEGLVA